ncbi:MAG: DUF6362 family protein [Acidocella sp.]|nr:DUF6362 family protein [Acidocella sp.]
MNRIRHIEFCQPAAGITDKTEKLLCSSKIAEIDAVSVVARLEAAGATLLAMPGQGYSTGLRQMRFDIVHTALEAYGWEAPPLRAPSPGAVAISEMDEVFGWLRFIPDGHYVMRRVVGARALVHPLTGRYLFTWRRLAATLGADHKSVQRWHGQGVAMVVSALRAAG